MDLPIEPIRLYDWMETTVTRTTSTIALAGLGADDLFSGERGV